MTDIRLPRPSRGQRPPRKAKTPKAPRAELLTLPARMIKCRLTDARKAGLEKPPGSYAELLAAWELPDPDRQLRRVARELRLRLAIFALAGLLAATGLALAGRPLATLPVVLAALVGAATTLWRLALLRERRFQPFCRWLGGSRRGTPPDAADAAQTGPAETTKENADGQESR